MVSSVFCKAIRVYITLTHSQSDQKGSCSSTLGDVSRIGVGEKLERSWSGLGLALGSAGLGLGPGFG